MNTIIEGVNGKAIFIVLIWIQQVSVVLRRISISGATIIVEDGHKFVFLFLCQSLDELRNHFVIPTDTPLGSLSCDSGDRVILMQR